MWIALVHKPNAGMTEHQCTASRGPQDTVNLRLNGLDLFGLRPVAGVFFLSHALKNFDRNVGAD